LNPPETTEARLAEWRDGLPGKRFLALVDPSAKNAAGPGMRSRQRPHPGQAFLALGVLLSLTGLLKTSLLTLDDACVTAQVAGLLQGGAVVLGVDLVQ
jgi:hypothetical protein